MTTIDEFTVPAATRFDLTSDDWCTSAELAGVLGTFDLDPCGNARSHIRSLHRYGLDLDLDGLVEPWSGSVFCNPPYSDVRPWADRLKAHPGPWAALVKLDPTTKWWREGFFGAPAHRPTWAAFSRRIKFERPDKPPLTANFPSALIWNNGWTPPDELWREWLFKGGYYQ